MRIPSFVLSRSKDRVWCGDANRRTAYVCMLRCFAFVAHVVTAVSVGAYAVWVLRRGRELAKHATREEMPWT